MFHHLNISILGIGLKVSIKSDYIALRIYRCLFRCKFLSRIMTSPEITGWKVKMREIDWNKQEWMERFVSVKVIISIQERLEDNFLVCLGLASTKTHQQQNIKLSLFVVICRTVHLFWDWVTKYCRSSIALHMVNWSSATKISSAPFIYLSHTVKSAISWSGEKLKPPLGDQLCDGGLHPGDDGPAWGAQWGEWFLILPLCTCHGWNWSNEFR